MEEVGGPARPGSEEWWFRRILGRLAEPRAITASQVVQYVVTGAAGVLALSGGLPNLLNATVGVIAAVVVGSVLISGGIVGAVACLRGAWWAERVALLVCALGWVLCLPAAVTFAFAWHRARWLIVLLILLALGDIFKRYRRIDWAYLDPSR